MSKYVSIFFILNGLPYYDNQKRPTIQSDFFTKPLHMPISSLIVAVYVSDSSTATFISVILNFSFTETAGVEVANQFLKRMKSAVASRGKYVTLQEEDDDPQNFVCTLCDKCFTGEEALHRHSVIHKHERKYKCTECSKRCKSLHGLKHHMKVHNSDEEIEVRCNICDKVFPCKRNLKVHTLVHEDKKLYQCTICGKTYKWLESLRKHEKYAHEEERVHKCDECPKSYKYPETLTEHKKTHSNSVINLRCRLCLKVFSSKDALKQHTATHDDKRPYVCEICGKTYKWSANWKHHVRNAHGEERKYKCDICPKSYKYPATLSQHKRTHAVVKNRWRCSLCLKGFTRESAFKQHTVKHGNLKPYDCIVCDRSYRWHRDLRNHMIREHEVTVLEERNEPVDETQPKRERTFQCAICDKTFFTKANLKVHLIVHTGLKPYNCNDCTKSYRHRRSLIAHEERENHGQAETDESSD